jgi:hypothetical protein
MQSFFRTFLAIAQSRQGPRDLPPSWPLLLLSGALYLLTSILQSRLLFGPAGALTQGLADLTLTAAFFALVLLLRGCRHRLLQTLIAIFGVGTLFALPMLGILLVRQSLGITHVLSAMLSLASFPLLLWYLVVLGRLVKAALEVPFVLGFGCAMIYVALGYWLIPLVSTMAVV